MRTVTLNFRDGSKPEVVRELEAEGLTRSDAQAIADVEGLDDLTPIEAERKPVDVLAVMQDAQGPIAWQADRAIERYEADCKAGYGASLIERAREAKERAVERCAQLTEASAAVAELIEAVKTQRAIAAHVEPWKTPDVRQGYAKLVGLGPFATRAEIEKRADDNVRAALARAGGA